MQRIIGVTTIIILVIALSVFVPNRGFTQENPGVVGNLNTGANLASGITVGDVHPNLG